MAKKSGPNLRLLPSKKRTDTDQIRSLSLSERNEVQKEYSFSIAHSLATFLNNASRSEMTKEQVVISLNDSIAHIATITMDNMQVSEAIMKFSGNGKKLRIQITMEDE